MLHNISGGAGARQWLAGITLVIVGGLGFITSGYAASLDPKVLPVIQAATFEVVSAKPGQDPLQYERPLPFDLLPFQERNDKYYSIGTAFAIGGGRYVTAAHVLLTGANSLWGPPALRDSHGRVYAIDKVRKFSLEKDFVVFTLTEQPGDAALLLDTSAVQGQTVYSVGNAYGTGVVIRDGLYTSDTPEDQDGRWKWVRFSAPASPGNSGGPLVDQDGKVVAIVLAKSPNENLNYGLPIGMVQAAADGVAEFDQRIPYQFDVFDSTLSDTLKSQFALPLSLDAFFDLYQQRTNAYFDKELKALLAKEPQRTFPNGDGASELLHQVASMEDFPKVIARNSSGTWVLAGEANDNIKLSSNGYVTPGAFGKNSLFHLRRPDDVPADRLYGDAAVPMDLLLKSGFIKRQIGTQNIEVTSLGKPTLQSIHLDAWGRRWQVWEWPLPYANAILLVLALPVPDGYVGVMRYSLAGSEHDQMINTTALTDFMYVNYDGRLAQWKEYLRHADLLPVAFHDIHIDFDYGRRFRYASSRVHFDVTPDVQAVQPDSVLTLGFSY
ncbi:MAG: trypsin-like serine protease with C-terminal domain, partial [Xanthomonadaceae bacterium]|nr:trypsin-like serine protease with C-terminal domain [Xanthomonadaceae bacterium]